MNTPARIMIVDDDRLMRLMLEKALSDQYQCVSVSSGQACLDSFKKHQPDLILMDVEMPQMDGYETCQRLKSLDDTTPPVIFISSRERVEDRLRGYDAGGDDYIMKPIDADELLTKVTIRLKAVEDRHQIGQMLASASTAAMTALSSMGEMGVILQALQRFNACATLEKLADEVLVALREYDLSGVVRLRPPCSMVTQSTEGTVTPIESSVIEQVATMGRIVEYHSRLSVSYDYATILVNNIPEADEDRRGRLRDHLAVLAEAAHIRAQAIHHDQLIARTTINASRALDLIDESQRAVRTAALQALQHMSDELDRAFLNTALSDQQEALLVHIVEKGIEQTRHALLPGNTVQQQLTAVINELKSATHAA